ncbi:hypothetical protein K9M79_05630 [Candidatus Woesearchaeota archaeon]|nr:hypothetical protein [Candidatus Woesearchaeota archaeon]
MSNSVFTVIIFVVLTSSAFADTESLDAFLDCHYELSFRDDVIRGETIDIHAKIPTCEDGCHGLHNCMIYLTIQNSDGVLMQIIQGRDEQGKVTWSVILESGAEYAQVIDPNDKFELGWFKKKISRYLGGH